MRRAIEAKSSVAPACATPRRRSFPRYRPVFGVTFCTALLLAVPIILLGPGTEGRLWQGAATAFGAMILGVIVRNQGTLRVGRRGLAIFSGLWFRPLLRWSEVLNARIADDGLLLRTERGVLRVEHGYWHWCDLIEAVASKMDAKLGIPLARKVAPRQGHFTSLAMGEWSWPSKWLALGGLVIVGVGHFLFQVDSGELQARLYFQGFLCLLAAGRIVLSSRQAYSLRITGDGLVLQTAGELHSVPWEEVIAVVDGPSGWVIRTRQGDFDVKRWQTHGRRVHELLMLHTVPRVIFEPGPPYEWRFKT